MQMIPVLEFSFFDRGNVNNIGESLHANCLYIVYIIKYQGAFEIYI
jgi:hypothetical protein